MKKQKHAKKSAAMIFIIIFAILAFLAALFFINKPKEPNEPGVTYYTVTFETNGGGTIEDQSILSGSLVVEPENPKKEGYVFAGWFSDKNLTESYNFLNPVNKNLTLFAKWSGESKPVEKEEDKKQETQQSSQDNKKPTPAPKPTPTPTPTPEPEPEPEPEPVLSYSKEDVEGSVTNQVRIFVLKDGVKVNGTVKITYLGGKSAVVNCPASGYVEDGGIIVSISEPKI